MSASAYGLAVAAGALAGPVMAFAGARITAPAVRRLEHLIAAAGAALRATLAPLRLAESHGHDPSSADRRRLRVVGTLAGALAGWMIAGVGGAIVTAAAGGATMPRVAGWRRARYARRVESGAAAAAQAMAGALAGGGSIRAAIAAAGMELEGPISVELCRTAVDLEAGARLDSALEALVDRAPSRSIVLIAAAVELQRRSGGDLAALLRRLAVSLEDERRATEEANAATAQARLTSMVVLALPPAGIVFAELASPGLLGRMLGSAAGATLIVLALGLQLAGAVLVRRLARVGT